MLYRQNDRADRTGTVSLNQSPCTWREKDMRSEHRRDAVSSPLLLIFLFCIRFAAGAWVTGVWMEDRRTERNGRDEQDTTRPSEDPQNNEEGFLAALSSSSFWVFFFFSLIRLGLGGPWKANIPVGCARSAFDRSHSWRLVYTHLKMLYNSTSVLNFFRVSIVMGDGLGWFLRTASSFLDYRLSMD